MLTDIEKIDTILTHIHKVEENCIKLGKKLMKRDLAGDKQLGLMLIKNARLHDLSKFDDLEFEYLFPTVDQSKFELALQKHRLLNKHHPESWGDIQHMPVLYLAEMVCDCVARSNEFGTDIRRWFFENATKIYGFKENDEVGKMIKEFLDLLLTTPFERINIKACS